MNEIKATVNSVITEVVDKMCEEYCKYPELVYSQIKDPDDANAYLLDHYCQDCPLNRLQ